jgi:hypothetical protein
MLLRNCTVHSEVKQPECPSNKPNALPGTGIGGYTSGVDKEVLFQFERTIHQPQKLEQLGKKMIYEWPFEFGFVEGSGQGFALPSSGKYHDSRVEYKINAVMGKHGEDEEKVKQKINLEKKPSNFHETDSGLWARKQIGDIVERKINFVRIRSDAFIDDYIHPPFVGLWRSPHSACLLFSRIYLPQNARGSFILRTKGTRRRFPLASTVRSQGMPRPRLPIPHATIYFFSSPSMVSLSTDRHSHQAKNRSPCHNYRTSCRILRKARLRYSPLPF